MERLLLRHKASGRRGLEFISILVLVLMFASFTFMTCGEDSDSDDGDDKVSSRAYQGHESDVDINNFVQVYPYTIGTRLDDCQTCHRGAWVVGAKGDEFKNPCDFCHLLVHPDEDITGGPTDINDTLNPYGHDYNNYGRDKDAIRDIHMLDSDSDSYTNVEEIQEIRYPGDPSSHPGQPQAKLIILSMDDLEEIPKSEHLQLNNAMRQITDDYAYYEGVRIKDLLEAVGVDMTNVLGISVIAPDGFVKDFTLDEINNQFPDGEFWPNLDTGPTGLGPDCGFVVYPPAEYTTGLGDGSPLPNQWLMLGYARDGAPMQKSYLDPESLQIEGEGPYRLILPQENPGKPDRGSKYSKPECADEYDYDDTKDHNAGRMVRGVVAIRLNPMPEGYEEFDYMNGGWAYIDTEEVIIYGQGVE